jgi:isopentenyldiphosphate isomerase
LEEEMGVTGIEILPLLTFKMNYGINDNEISRLFEGIVDPENVRFDPIEIEEIGYFSVDEIREMMKEGKVEFCGWFIEILNWYLGNPSKLSMVLPG